MQEVSETPAGLVKFYSKDELRRYMKNLVAQYQVKAEAHGDHLGGILREIEQEKGATKPAESAKGQQKGQGKGWVKMGTLLVSVGEPTRAMAEILFQIHEDAKAKLAKVTEAVKSFDELASTTIPEAGVYFLQLRNGVPERIVADTGAAGRGSFSYSADFKLV